MPYGKIAFHQQVGLRELSGEMKVAHLPCPVSGFPLVRIRDSKDFFGFLVYDVILVFLRVKTNSMSERRFQIETEVSPVLCLPTPSALGKNSPFHRQRDRIFKGFAVYGIELFDKLHGQKRKYL
jgi:hypothetical protein